MEPSTIPDPPAPADHVTHGVYIGGARLLYLAPTLRIAGVTNILKLYEDMPNWDWPSDFTVCDDTISDGDLIPAIYLERGVSFIREHIEAGDKVLVVCGAGISRSSTFVLAYLLERGDDLREAWQLLKAAHPQANPHPRLWESLINYYDLPYTLDDVIAWA